MMPAIKNGIISNDPFIGTKITAKLVMRGFLSVEEIKQLERLTDLTDAVAQALDLFLFACYTGMAAIQAKSFG